MLYFVYKENKVKYQDIEHCPGAWGTINRMSGIQISEALVAGSPMEPLLSCACAQAAVRGLLTMLKILLGVSEGDRAAQHPTCKMSIFKPDHLLIVRLKSTQPAASLKLHCML